MPMQTDRLICKYYNSSEEGGLVFATRLEKRDLMIMQTAGLLSVCWAAQNDLSSRCEMPMPKYNFLWIWDYFICLNICRLDDYRNFLKYAYNSYEQTIFKPESDFWEQFD